MNYDTVNTDKEMDFFEEIASCSYKFLIESLRAAVSVQYDELPRPVLVSHAHPRSVGLPCPE